MRVAAKALRIKLQQLEDYVKVQQLSTSLSMAMAWKYCKRCLSREMCLRESKCFFLILVSAESFERSLEAPRKWLTYVLVWPLEKYATSIASVEAVITQKNI